LHARVHDCMMRGVIIPAVSIGHSFILVTFTSAMGCVCGDMVIQAAGGAARCLWWWFVVVIGTSSLVDESVSGNVDSEGNSGARQGSAWLRCVICRVTSSVGFPESCKCLLKLLVRSSVRVEGCQDRVGSSDVEEPCQCQKKVKGAWLGSLH
jgi:hypothetical protein